MATQTHTFEQNLADAAEHLAPFAEAPLLHLIGGEAVPSASGETFTNHSPIDSAVLGEVASGDSADIHAAAEAASEAFGVWQSMGPVGRQRVLRDVARLITERARQIALVECVDTGQTMRFMSAAAVRGAANFTYFADMATSVADGHSLPTDTHINYTTRKAIGPVGSE